MANTTSEAAIRALVAQGKKFPEIANELGVNIWSLRTTCSVLGIRSPKRAASADVFYRDLCTGMTMREIGEKYGMSGQNVHNTLKRAGLPTSAVAVLRQQAEQRKAA